MRSVQLAASSQGPRFVEADAPMPSAGKGEVLIQVCAAGVTPTELLCTPQSTTKTAHTGHTPYQATGFSGVIYRDRPRRERIRESETKSTA